ncbi:hypothetical protein [Helicobacter cetorum]|uniref:Uncharacterized protein n=1 Tax=Helicobacter cetorum (strain ATCC BAA-540 / CCUG 52418 / MIT 99-5656) TaxID=1163745 RepID=I0ERE1_HELCM|nr:hypothetical protein [Helicobacter cetorum]AFI05510.1 hypothetical protein HCD_02450 [Helicobacter cetorum MIT 99-5656]
MLEVSEIIYKVRKRLNDTNANDYLFSDDEMLDCLNVALLDLILEFRLNRKLKTQTLTKENPSIEVSNLLGILSVKFNHNELNHRVSIEKESGETSLLILGDTLSVTPFKEGVLEVVIISYEPKHSLMDSIDLPEISLNILVYSMLISLLEIPTNDLNMNKIANYKQLLQQSKNNLKNYLNCMYSKNGSFKCSLSFKLNSIKNHLKYNTNFLNKSLKNNFIPLILIVSSY